MSDAYNSWMKSALGVDVGRALKKIESTGSTALNRVTASRGAARAGSGHGAC